MTATSATNSGTLYIVATPIGNQSDITQRAIETLQSVDLILAEDTRHSKRLLNAFGIKKPLKALHAHNESKQTMALINKLLQGQTLALISDAGTPLISDPGFPLVQQAHQHQIEVVPIPGACAFITALSAAGVPCDTITFAGFLPAKSAARRNKLAEFTAYPHTLVFYESTHRLLDSIQDIALLFGPQTKLVLAKELTKTFEHFFFGDADTLTNTLLADPNRLKGEFVLIIPARAKACASDEEPRRILRVLLKELPLKQAVKLTSTLTGNSKNDLYQLALTLSK